MAGVASAPAPSPTQSDVIFSDRPPFLPKRSPVHPFREGSPSSGAPGAGAGATRAGTEARHKSVGAARSAAPPKKHDDCNDKVRRVMACAPPRGAWRATHSPHQEGLEGGWWACFLARLCAFLGGGGGGGGGWWCAVLGGRGGWRTQNAAWRQGNEYGKAAAAAPPRPCRAGGAPAEPPPPRGVASSDGGGGGGGKRAAGAPAARAAARAGGAAHKGKTDKLGGRQQSTQGGAAPKGAPRHRRLARSAHAGPATWRERAHARSLYMRRGWGGGPRLRAPARTCARLYNRPRRPALRRGAQAGRGAS
ncbi:MAG: hypothetical protein J3K34DRAFT_99265 [Monoraphidium minutum]|nr:MAG: hypothetical protein J3K34DRAFT_99265 [Monoraphidium minutum]